MIIKILKSVEELKDNIMKRQTLVNRRKSTLLRIRDGCNFFEQVNPRTSHSDLVAANKMMKRYLSELEEIDDDIFALDTVIASRLEAEFLDSVIKIRTRKSQNEAGDTIKSTNFFFMPEDYKDGDYMTIDERDLWFLKIVKAAFSLQNIEVIQRGDLDD